MAQAYCKDVRRSGFRAEMADPCRASLKIRYQRIRFQPSACKATKYPALELSVLNTTERLTNFIAPLCIPN